MLKYQIVVWWSDRDASFLSCVPELPGCICHGDSPEEAWREMSILLPFWLQVLRESGQPIPEPAGHFVAMPCDPVYGAAPETPLDEAAIERIVSGAQALARDTREPRSGEARKTTNGTLNARQSKEKVTSAK